jgi:tripeptidyl-peptidase-1
MLYKSLAAGLAATAATASYSDSRKQDWKVLGRADSNSRTRFTVGMAMRDQAGLERTLMDISDPTSPNYGKWLTKEEADAFTATPTHIRKEVKKWAQHTGAQCVDLAEALRCEGSVDSIEKLFKTELSEYGHKTKGKRIIRTSADASVPDRFKDKITVVTGLTQFPVPKLGSWRPVSVIHDLADNDYTIVPQTLQKIYNITFDGSSSSTQAAVEFQGYPAYVQADTDTFATNTGIKTWSVPTAQIIGPFQPEEGAAESTLDEQYIGSVGQNNNNWYWTEADWLFEFGNDIANQPDAQLPNVLSISYAWWELDQCDISPGVAPCNGQPVQSGSVAFVNACNALFAKAAARGVTMSAASGDSGAHGRTDPGCTDPHTRVEFPASSPWITGVGATELENGQTGTVNAPICQSTLQCATGGYEIVASNKVLAFFSSGGGFSTITARPSWQDSVVKKYLTNSSAIPPTTDFNTSGRAIPDVAALGHNYYIEMGGVSSVDGTSAATPVWSALVANLNSWRKKNGKPVLGFINPLIYSIAAANPKAFFDVVQGDNTCTESACPCPAGTGFYAAPGWDATTGLGTPNYGQIKAGITAMGI